MVGMTAQVRTHAELATRVLAGPPLVGHSRLVAVDGPSGAGKTLFATRLADALDAARPPGPVADPVVTVVHTDDLLDGWDDQLTFWGRLEELVLDPLRAGRAGAYRRYSWLRGEFTPRQIVVEPTPVVIIEGVTAARAAIRPELSLAVFVFAPADLCRRRALERDGQTLGPHLETWRQVEDVHFQADRTAEHADLVVDGAALPPDDAGRYVVVPGPP